MQLPFSTARDWFPKPELVKRLGFEGVHYENYSDYMLKAFASCNPLFDTNVSSLSKPSRFPTRHSNQCLSPFRAFKSCNPLFDTIVSSLSKPSIFPIRYSAPMSHPFQSLQELEPAIRHQCLIHVIHAFNFSNPLFDPKCLIPFKAFRYWNPLFDTNASHLEQAQRVTHLGNTSRCPFPGFF